jgi:hypothetical protein
MMFSLKRKRHFVIFKFPKHHAKLKQGHPHDWVFVFAHTDKQLAAKGVAIETREAMPRPTCRLSIDLQSPKLHPKCWFTEARQHFGMINNCRQLERIQLVIHMFPFSLFANPNRQSAARGAATATRRAMSKTNTLICC